MPSGSHAGSPGSHSSGGASFGGGSFGGGPRGSHGPQRSSFRGGFTMIFFGRGAGSGEGSIAFAWIFMAIIGFVFSIAFAGAVSVVNGNIAKIKEDYAYYQTMINMAKQNPSVLILSADVTDSFLGSGNKYYITYEYEYDTDKKLNGYTYSVYTREEAAALLGTGTVQIAINKAPVNANTDSITMDFDGRNYKDDGDYIQNLASKKAVIIVFSVILSIIAIFIVLVAVGTVKTLKKKNSPAPTKPDSDTSPAKPTTPTCAYCGSTLKEGQTQCPSCGARVRKK